MPTFEEKYFDVLQNIEFAIVDIYRKKPELTDYDVDKVLNALIRFYQAERQQRTFTRPVLSTLAKQLYESAQWMCDWRLGRESMDTKDRQSNNSAPEPIALEEVITCLKRIRKSVNKWNKRGGTRGYLQYVDQFMA